jgi:hypothetical protein
MCIMLKRSRRSRASLPDAGKSSGIGSGANARFRQ